MDINQLNGKKVTYENRKFQGNIKTIARLHNESDQVVSVSFVTGENEFLGGYVALQRKIKNGKSKLDHSAGRARKLLEKGLTRKEVAKKMKLQYDYLSQIIMLYQLK